ncbi:glycosyltransferase family 39 protein [Egbenema bharatensis]|uniref:glycosyltransferase family 39 protein n=1 Tax=Egbenema bharatensis TaxID=3463334 RepID=UPI003A8BB745
MMNARRFEGWKKLPVWFRYGVILVIILGIFFRFYNIDYKVYWIDEANTSLRSLGYTRSEFIDAVFTGEVVRAEVLQQYQQPDPDRGWDDTMNALMGTAEHTPLYFMLSRLWVDGVGHSVTTMRLLAALFSLLMLPCLFWLCRLLFESPAVAWIAVALVSISPLHILYAQEARPYSLFSLLFLLSSALLLRILQAGQAGHTGQTAQTGGHGRKRLGWLLYGVTITAGLYTHLLFSLVVLAQGLYVGLTEPLRVKGRINRSVLSYGMTAGIAFLLLSPWIVLLFNNLETVRVSTVSLGQAISMSRVIDSWFLNASRIFVDRDLGSANGIFVLLSGVSVGFLWRKAPKRAWLFIILIIATLFLTLAVPDLLWGGRRSTRIRYLLPAVLGIQMSLAFVFATQAVWARTWGQQVWRLIMVAVVSANVFANMSISQSAVPWSKSPYRSAYFIPVSEVINQAANPLLISDGPIVDTLAFATWLRPDIAFQLARDPDQITIADGFDPIYLLTPSDELRDRVAAQGYTVTEFRERSGLRGDPYPFWQAQSNGE